MSTSVPTIGLLANGDSVSFADLVDLARVLQKQVNDDLFRLWGLRATVTAFRDTASFTYGAWPIIFVSSLANNLQGYHLLSNNIPSAFVLTDAQMSVFASHECLEMIVDSTGRSRTKGPNPTQDGTEVEFLLEVCDPCVAYENAYPIDGNWVSDFVSPAYYSAEPGATEFSSAGRVAQPAQVLPEGYLTWYAPTEQQWYQRTSDARGNIADAAVQIPDIESLPARAAVDRYMRSRTRPRRRRPQVRKAQRQHAANLTYGHALAVGIEQHLGATDE